MERSSPKTTIRVRTEVRSSVLGTNTPISEGERNLATPEAPPPGSEDRGLGQSRPDSIARIAGGTDHADAGEGLGLRPPCRTVTHTAGQMAPVAPPVWAEIARVPRPIIFGGFGDTDEVRTAGALHLIHYWAVSSHGPFRQNLVSQIDSSGPGPQARTPVVHPHSPRPTPHAARTPRLTLG